ncbi:unnamed protein product [Prorocentrum cordatum]|uniref:Non-reducing end alpha-L-arabinofuranosidase n=1 Tax=Prorocentrum cordatum TaxID=2364126 RepID=A0ABN9S3F7_9DINO|nr:unnamed protein product [Polarella glacialis]
MTLRIGGSAADDLGFNSTHGTIRLDAGYWDRIVAFASRCGFRLAWDLNMRVGRGPGVLSNVTWDPQDVVRQLDHMQSARQSVWAFQLGNEPGHWQTRNAGFPTPDQHGRDFVVLDELLRRYYPEASRRPRIQGPDVCFGQGTQSSPCASMAYLRRLLSSANHTIDDLTVHDYGFQGPDPRDPSASKCGNLSRFLDPDLWAGRVLPTIDAWDAVRRELVPRADLVLSETATTADAGCPGKSNRFVAGFYFVDILGVLGERGLAQVYRQDLVGFSGIGGGSSYAMMGPPGWYSASGSGRLTPHPDYFTALLWRSLVGPTRLRASVAAPRCAPGAARFHAACAVGGGVVVSYINPSSTGFALKLAVADSAHVAAGAELELYVLTAPYGNLTSDGVLLNGNLLAPGSSLRPVLQPSSTAAQIPPFSYGFVVDRSATRTCHARALTQSAAQASAA